MRKPGAITGVPITDPGLFLRDALESRLRQSTAGTVSRRIEEGREALRMGKTVLLAADIKRLTKNCYTTIKLKHGNPVAGEPEGNGRGEPGRVLAERELGPKNTLGRSTKRERASRRLTGYQQRRCQTCGSRQWGGADREFRHVQVI